MLRCRVCIEANHPSRPCQRNIQLLALNHPQASAAKCFWAISQDQGDIGGHLLLMNKFRHAVCNQGEALCVHCDSDCRLTAPSCHQTHTRTRSRYNCRILCPSVNLVVKLRTYWFVASAAVRWSNAWHACCRVQGRAAACVCQSGNIASVQHLHLTVGVLCYSR